MFSVVLIRFVNDCLSDLTEFLDFTELSEECQNTLQILFGSSENNPDETCPEFDYMFEDNTGYVAPPSAYCDAGLDESCSTPCFTNQVSFLNHLMASCPLEDLTKRAINEDYAVLLSYLWIMLSTSTLQVVAKCKQNGYGQYCGELYAKHDLSIMEVGAQFDEESSPLSVPDRCSLAEDLECCTGEALEVSTLVRELYLKSDPASDDERIDGIMNYVRSVTFRRISEMCDIEEESIRQCTSRELPPVNSDGGDDSNVDNDSDELEDSSASNVTLDSTLLLFALAFASILLR